MKIQDIVDIFSSLKLNPMAKEFFPSSYSPNEITLNYFTPAFYINSPGDGIQGYSNNRRRRNNYSQGRRRLNGRAFRAQREDIIKRTVYVSDIDHNVTEERLAALFGAYGHVLDCRVCGDPNSLLRFAFVEFTDENSARAALNLCGIMLGFSEVRVLPSKTAILPVNPTFLPSQRMRNRCAQEQSTAQILTKRFPKLRLKFSLSQDVARFLASGFWVIKFIQRELLLWNLYWPRVRLLHWIAVARHWEPNQSG